MRAESGHSCPGSASGARAELEVALLEAIWHAWFYGDRDTTIALAESLRTARSQTPDQAAPDRDWQN